MEFQESFLASQHYAYKKKFCKWKGHFYIWEKAGGG